MPTGFTCVIDDNPDVTFREFALRCVRGMGVCIDMRDESIDKPPPVVVKPDTYHLKEKRKAEERLRRFQALTLEEAAKLCEQEYKDRVEQWIVTTEQRNAVTQRYQAMLAQVEAWQPPTKEHEGFKRFMIEQLKTGGLLDYSTDDSFMEPKRKTPQEWLTDRIAQAQRDISYHKKEWAKQVNNVKKRNEWLKVFYASIQDE